MVNKGEIKPELAEMFERALRDEQDGKSIVMRDPGIRPRPPKRPSWADDGNSLHRAAHAGTRYETIPVSCVKH